MKPTTNCKNNTWRQTNGDDISDLFVFDITSEWYRIGIIYTCDDCLHKYEYQLTGKCNEYFKKEAL